MSTVTRPLRALADVHLGRQRSPEHADGPNMVQYLRAANVTDGAIDVSDVKEMNFSPKEQSFFSLREGDVLVTEGSGSIRAVGASAVWRAELPGTVCFQNTLLRLRPRASTTDARYLAWWCRYAFSDGLFASASSGANIFHLSADRLRSLPIAAPDLRKQERIADYLDAATRKIDAVVRSRTLTLELLNERLESEAERLLVTAERVPLRRIAELLAGYTFSSEDFSPSNEGARLLRGVNVGVDSLRWDDTVRLGNDGASHRRYVLRQGDIVLGMDRPFISGGTRVAQVRECDAGALLVQRVCRIRTTAPEDAQIVRWALRSRRFAAHVEPDLTGVSVPHLSEQQIGSFPVPFLSSRRRQESVLALKALDERHRRMQDLLSRQIALLQERKHALITAAVTGQLDVAVSAA